MEGGKAGWRGQMRGPPRRVDAGESQWPGIGGLGPRGDRGRRQNAASPSTTSIPFRPVVGETSPTESRSPRWNHRRTGALALTPPVASRPVLPPPVPSRPPLVWPPHRNSVHRSARARNRLREAFMILSSGFGGLQFRLGPPYPASLSVETIFWVTNYPRGSLAGIPPGVPVQISSIGQADILDRIYQGFFQIVFV